MSNKEDLHLIRVLKEEPNKGFELIYKKYFKMVQHFVINNSGTTADSKDVFQEAIIALFELTSKPDFKLTSALSTLIYSIGRNKWLKKLRGEKKRIDIKDFEKYIPIQDDYDYELDEQIIEVEKAIDTLGEPCRGILIGFYYKKMSMIELAQANGYATSDHAKAQKYKCLKRLKKIAA